MRVLLINPPNLNYARLSTGWDFEIANIGFFPPYGLISLAAYIRQYRNYEIRVLDCVAENVNFNKLRHYLKEFQPAIVGIGAFTYTLYDVLQTAYLVKEVSPGAHICIGGPHVTLFPEETIHHAPVDSLVLGDGEVPFLSLLSHLEEGRWPAGIPGVICKGNQFTPISQNDTFYTEDLDSLPFPAYDLINGRRYRGTLGSAARMACICSSRGCPYSCTFCQVLVKRYRAHSVDYIIDMMKYLYRQGYREFYFFDDLFNVTAQRVIEISEAILSNRLKISWLFRGRADRINEEVTKVASLAGCTHIILGVEDYTNEGLKRIKKGITIEQVKNAIESAHRYNMEVSTNWIIGLPNHKTPDDIKKLVTASIALGSDYAQYTVLQLLPGCEMYEEAISEGVIHRARWSEFVKNPVPDYQIEPYDKNISLDELNRLYKYCHEKFYRRPSYILRRLTKLRNIYEFNRMIKPAIKIMLG